MKPLSFVQVCRSQEHKKSVSKGKMNSVKASSSHFSAELVGGLRENTDLYQGGTLQRTPLCVCVCVTPCSVCLFGVILDPVLIPADNLSLRYRPAAEKPHCKRHTKHSSHTLTLLPDLRSEKHAERRDDSGDGQRKRSS